MANNDRVVQIFIDLLAKRFSLKDLGLLSVFLELKSFLTPHGLILSQRRYTNNLLTHIHITNAKLVLTPLATTLNSNTTLKYSTIRSY